MSSPCAATRSRAYFETGAKGSSWISEPATIGNGLVEQVDQLAEHPGLGLAAQAQKQHVVLGEDRVLDLGDHGLLVAEDLGKQRLARLELGDQVAPHLILDRLDPISARLQLAQGPGPIRHSSLACLSWWTSISRRRINESQSSC